MQGSVDIPLTFTEIWDTTFRTKDIKINKKLKHL